jgi:hypothetical protein
MGQMLKEFREKRENIIPLKVGRNNKMATGGSPSTQRLMISPPPTPSPRPTLLFFYVNYASENFELGQKNFFFFLQLWTLNMTQN